VKTISVFILLDLYKLVIFVLPKSIKVHCKSAEVYQSGMADFSSVAVLSCEKRKIFLSTVAARTGEWKGKEGITPKA
jgi:hypothetical protein